ncbi:MAG: sigma-70 family RNA polymerase sigma factor, partial [Verrucomicrobiota bacterium]
MDPQMRQKPDFPSTHWSVVLSARDPDSVVAGEALSTLCANYWFPLYAYARRRGKPPEEAEDLTQGFFATLLSNKYFDDADPAKGRLRT